MSLHDYAIDVVSGKATLRVIKALLHYRGPEISVLPSHLLDQPLEVGVVSKDFLIVDGDVLVLVSLLQLLIMRLEPFYVLVEPFELVLSLLRDYLHYASITVCLRL